MHGTVYVNPTGTVARRRRPRRRPRPTGDRREPDAHPAPPRPAGGGSAAPLSSFRAKASVRKRKVFLTLTVGGDKAAAGARDAQAREQARAPRRACSRGPGATSSACRARRLKPGRYTLTLKAGDLRRVVHFRVRRS